MKSNFCYCLPHHTFNTRITRLPPLSSPFFFRHCFLIDGRSLNSCSTCWRRARITCRARSSQQTPTFFWGRWCQWEFPPLPLPFPFLLPLSAFLFFIFLLFVLFFVLFFMCLFTHPTHFDGPLFNKAFECCLREKSLSRIAIHINIRAYTLIHASVRAKVPHFERWLQCVRKQSTVKRTHCGYCNEYHKCFVQATTTTLYTRQTYTICENELWILLARTQMQLIETIKL